MHPVLDRNLFLVKEHVGAFKAANEYDIYDPATGEMIAQCREPDLGGFTRLLRFTDYKRQTPFDIRITATDGTTLVQVTRGWTWIRSVVEVRGDQNELVGTFRQKLLSIGGAFAVLAPNGEELCHLKGKWTSWDFRFVAGERELAHITKKWAGLGKELFTSADNYVLEIADDVPRESRLRQLILAAVMSIDMVLKE